MIFMRDQVHMIERRDRRRLLKRIGDYCIYMSIGMLFAFSIMSTWGANG